MEEYRSRTQQVWNSGVHRNHCNFTERRRGWSISEAVGKMTHNMKKMKLDFLPQAIIKSTQPTFPSLFFPCSLLCHHLFLSQHGGITCGHGSWGATGGTGPKTQRIRTLTSGALGKQGAGICKDRPHSWECKAVESSEEPPRTWVNGGRETASVVKDWLHWTNK